MNTLINSHPHDIYKTYEATGKFKPPEPYTKNYKLYIEHMLSFFAHIQLYKNTNGDKISMYKTLHNIPKDGIGGMSLLDIKGLVSLASQLPRSKMVHNMSRNKENARLGSLTPLFMYAHKLNNNIRYSDWDANDQYIDIALGSFLAKALKFQKAYPLIESVGKDASIRYSLLSDRTYVQYPKYLQYTHKCDDTEEVGETIHYPKEWLTLDCQFWLANRELRHEKAMLLDIAHFGVVPKALDAGILISAAKAASKETARETPWA